MTDIELLQQLVTQQGQQIELSQQLVTQQGQQIELSSYILLIEIVILFYFFTIAVL